MAAKPLKMVRDRAGVALSRRLLRDLGSRSMDNDFPSPAGEMAVDASHRSTRDSAHQQCFCRYFGRGRATSPEFRIYSSFGDSVPAAPRLEAQRLRDIRRCRLKVIMNRTS